MHENDASAFFASSARNSLKSRCLPFLAHLEFRLHAGTEFGTLPTWHTRSSFARKRLNARGCCLVGDPAYYGRFGFKNIPGFIHEGIPQEYFLALPFDGHRPQGTVAFHGAFHATFRKERT